MTHAVSIDIDDAGTPLLQTPDGTYPLIGNDAAELLTELASAVALSLEAAMQRPTAASNTPRVPKRSKWHRSEDGTGYVMRVNSDEARVWREAQNKWFAKLNDRLLNNVPISTKTDAYGLVEQELSSDDA